MKKGDKVRLIEDEICESDDCEFLEGLLNQILTVNELSIDRDFELTYYELLDEAGSIISYKDGVSFGFIESEIRAYTIIDLLRSKYTYFKNILGGYNT